MVGVIWHGLTLHGFGRYPGTVTLELADGLNHLVAANEAGKSTLVAGLCAVLFGLPDRADPAIWGQARFRNWSGPPRFAGELEFTAGGIRYRIERNFQDHQVRLFTQTAGGWRQELAGAHNPGAQKRLAAYEERLVTLLGMDSRDLFVATFCVGQPLPEARQLDDRVQRLLSGGGSHVAEALERLTGKLKGLTRRTGDLGVTDRNGRNDGDLERLTQCRDDLAVREAAGRQAADSLLVLQADLAAAGAQEQKATADLRAAEESLAAWTSWRQALDRRSTALQEQVQLERSRQTGAALETDITGARQALERDYPEFGAAPVDAGTALEAAARLAARRDELQERHTTAMGALDAARAVQVRRQGQLTEEFAHLAGRPDLLRDRRDLDRRRQERAELAAQLAALAAETDRRRQAMAAMPEWGRLGRAPGAIVLGLRQRARDGLRNWRRFQETRGRHQQLTADLDRLPDWLRQLTPDQEGRLRQYDAERERLEREWEAAGRDLADADERQRRWQEASQTLAAEFADLAGVAADAATHLERQTELLGERDRLAAQVHAHRATLTAALALRRAMTAVAAGAILGMVVMAAAGFMQWEGSGRWVAVTVGALVGAGAGWVAGGRRAGAGDLGAGVATFAERKLGQVTVELQALAAVLGPLAAAGPMESGRLAERLRQRELGRQRLDELQMGVPDDAALAALRNRVKQLAELRQSFQQEAAAARDVFGNDVGAGYRDWQERLRERDEQARAAADISQAEWGCPPEAAADLVLTQLAEMAGHWAQLGLLRELSAHPGAPVAVPAPDAPNAPTLGALMAWLETLDAAHWEAWQRQAEAWDGHREALWEADARHGALLRRGSGAATQLDELDAAIANLSAAVAPWADTPLAELEPRIVACQRLEQEIQSAAAYLRAAAEQLQALDEELEQVSSALACTRGEMAGWLIGADIDVAAAWRRWQQREQSLVALRELEGRLHGLLAGHGAETVAALRERELGAAHRAVAAETELQRLTGAHPGLPTLSDAADPERLAAQHRLLSARVQEYRQQKTQAEERTLRLRGGIAELQGQRPLNIAQAELERTEVAADLQRLTSERDALAVAYHELRQAAEEFRRTYRDRLAASASSRFATLTGRPGRQVVIDDQFAISVHEADGRPVAVAQLSQGAQDQLWLALRFAIADQMAGEIALPFIFDDPFLNCDDERLELLRQDLTAMAAERQLLLLSCRPEFRQWGQPARLSQ